jgi:hypothetical protein
MLAPTPAPCICERQQNAHLAVSPSPLSDRQRVSCTSLRCLAGNPTWTRLIYEEPPDDEPGIGGQLAPIGADGA